MTTFREEGLRALWKGSVPALVGAVSENAVAFSVNQQLKRIIADMDGYGFGGEGGGGGGGGGGAAETAEESLIVPFLTGGFTGIFTSAALCPSDVIKCKVQVSRAMLKTGETAMDAKEMLAHVLKQQGVKGLFVGLGAQFARDIPFYAFFFGTYELSLRTLKTHTTVPQEAAYLVAGTCAHSPSSGSSLPPSFSFQNLFYPWGPFAHPSLPPSFPRWARRRGGLGGHHAHRHGQEHHSNLAEAQGVDSHHAGGDTGKRAASVVFR
jgi:solute carrier family 25 ornithine transporter 2/15